MEDLDVDGLLGPREQENADDLHLTSSDEEDEEDDDDFDPNRLELDDLGLGQLEQRCELVSDTCSCDDSACVGQTLYMVRGFASGKLKFAVSQCYMYTFSKVPPPYPPKGLLSISCTYLQRLCNGVIRDCRRREREEAEKVRQAELRAKHLARQQLLDASREELQLKVSCDVIPF